MQHFIIFLEHPELPSQLSDEYFFLTKQAHIADLTLGNIVWIVETKQEHQQSSYHLHSVFLVEGYDDDFEETSLCVYGFVGNILKNPILLNQYQWFVNLITNTTNKKQSLIELDSQVTLNNFLLILKGELSADTLLPSNELLNIELLSINDYIQALQSIKLVGDEKKLLLTHLNASNQSLTARQLAAQMGYQSWRTSNLNYGRLGSKFCKQLGIKLVPYKISILVKFVHPAEGELEWILRPNLAKALTVVFENELNNTYLAVQPEKIETQHNVLAEPNTTFLVDELTDSRTRSLALITLRQGQTIFREHLLKAYANTCIISGSNVTQILDAAHIHPYIGKETNRIDNGILLRTDLHTLFDLGLISINPIDMKINISSSLQDTEYWQWHKQDLCLHSSCRTKPNINALSWHWENIWQGN